LQARTLISKLTEEKNNAIQQNNKIRQELVSDYCNFILIKFQLPYLFFFLLGLEVGLHVKENIFCHSFCLFDNNQYLVPKY
jgi:hypothetical protein